MHVNMRSLASKIAAQEGKSHQASIGDIREILRILVGLIAQNPIQVLAVLMIEAGKSKTKL